MKRRGKWLKEKRVKKKNGQNGGCKKGRKQGGIRLGRHWPHAQPVINTAISQIRPLDQWLVVANLTAVIGAKFRECVLSLLFAAAGRDLDNKLARLGCRRGCRRSCCATSLRRRIGRPLITARRQTDWPAIGGGPCRGRRLCLRLRLYRCGRRCLLPSCIAW